MNKNNLSHYQKNKKYYSKYNKYYYLKKILEDPDYNKKKNLKRKKLSDEETVIT